MTDNPANPQLRKALELARSADWQERLEAIRLLAPFLPEPDARESLVAMLDDADLAVIAAAAETLLIHRDTNGARQLLSVLNTGPDDAAFAISDRLLGLLNDHPDLVTWLRNQGAAGVLNPDHVSATLALAGIDPA